MTWPYWSIARYGVTYCPATITDVSATNPRSPETCWQGWTLSSAATGTVAAVKDKIRQAWSMRRHCRRVSVSRSGFSGFRFLRMFALRAVLPRRGKTTDRAGHHRRSRERLSLGAAVHPAADRRGPTLPARGRRSLVHRRDYVKITGRWVYLYRAIDQYGQVIDVLVFEKRDQVATRRFFTRALEQTPFQPR